MKKMSRLLSLCMAVVILAACLSSCKTEKEDTLYLAYAGNLMHSGAHENFRVVNDLPDELDIGEAKIKLIGASCIDAPKRSVELKFVCTPEDLNSFNEKYLNEEKTYYSDVPFNVESDQEIKNVNVVLQPKSSNIGDIICGTAVIDFSSSVKDDTQMKINGAQLRLPFESVKGKPIGEISKTVEKDGLTYYAVPCPVWEGATNIVVFAVNSEGEPMSATDFKLLGSDSDEIESGSLFSDPGKTFFADESNLDGCKVIISKLRNDIRFDVQLDAEKPLSEQKTVYENDGAKLSVNKMTFDKTSKILEMKGDVNGDNISFMNLDQMHYKTHGTNFKYEGIACDINDDGSFSFKKKISGSTDGSFKFEAIDVNASKNVSAEISL